MSANFLKAIFLPRAWSAIDMLPPGLARKEMRQLRNSFWGMLAIEAIFYAICFGFGFVFNRHLETPPWSGFAIPVLLAGVLGTMFFGLEMEENTVPFLLRMPVSRWRIFITKLTAALTTWVSYIAASVSLYLFVLVIWAPLGDLFGVSLSASSGIPGLSALFSSAAIPFVEAYVSGCVFFYLACACCSVRLKTVMGAFFMGGVVTGVLLWMRYQFAASYLYDVPTRLTNSGQKPALVSYLIIPYFVITGFLVVGVLGWLLWKRLRDMEEPRGADLYAQAVLPHQVSWSPVKGHSLFSVELRQKATLWLMLLGMPALIAFVASIVQYPWDHSVDFGKTFGCVIFLSLPIVAAISGLTFWTRSELNGTVFFLYQQPITRARLFYTKLLAVLLFNLAFIGVYCLPMICLEISSNDPELKEKAWQALSFFVASVSIFLCGMLYSPLRTSNLLGFISAILIGLVIYVPAAVMSAEDPAMAVFSVCMIGGVLVLLTWWNNLKCDVLNPSIRRETRQAGFGALLFAWGLVVAFTHPIDLLYLMGFDWYAH